MVRSPKSRAPAPPGVQFGQAGAPPPAPLGGTRAEALRRLQMGVIGVVAVLLLVGLASIIKDRAAQTETTVVAEAAATSSPQSEAPAADPLAEAGVVPDIPSSPSPAVGTQSPAASASSAPARTMPPGPAPGAR